MLKEKVDLSHLAERWPSSIVAREKIKDFTGGTLSPGRLANLDAVGEGPPGRMKIGRKIAYPVGPLVQWLENRAKLLR
ncbi:MAG: hypothetical protein U5L00_06790 [Desulfovermiculus sp.]|nr:hypothetical protein [Desulfovermiculus sp.]